MRRRLLALATVPAVLAAGLIGLAGAGHAAMADTPASGQGCVLGVVCLPGSSPSPTATPTPTTAPTPAPSSSAPSVLPTSLLPSSLLPVAPALGSNPLSAVGSAVGSSVKSAVGAVAGALPAPATAKAKAGQKTATATPGLVAATSDAVLTAASGTLTNFTYQGNVNVPLDGGGTQSMMKFTATSVDLSGGVSVAVTEKGTTVTTDSATQSFSDGVTFYSTELKASLAGVPLTFTPSTVSAVLLSVASLGTGVATVTMTNITTDHLLISGGMQETTQLSMTESPAAG
ncbi:MAG TPA: hypothetical protein VHF26_05980 [Trebonia sp.]|nr:hypothetical protein [Trebonia sp.]